MGRIELSKGRTGANTLGGYERTSALVGHFAGGPEAGVPVLLYGLEDAKGHSVTAGDDVLLYRNVSEYFRMGGNGARLWLLNVEETDVKSYAALVGNAAVRQLIAEADGEIFQLGFMYEQPEPAAAVFPTGLVEAVQAAQGLADWCGETNRPVHIALEGAGMPASLTTAGNLRGLMVKDVVLDGPQVSVMVGQDFDFAGSLEGARQRYADVGTLLGCMARQGVNRNVGEVESMGLTNAPQGVWVNAGFSNHMRVKDVEGDLETLNVKGYIYGEYYAGKVVLNDDHNCVEERVDAEGNMNENCMSVSRTNAKILRELYRGYLPKIKSTYPVADDGTLEPGMVKYFEGIGDGVFNRMAEGREISDGWTVVDKTSNLLTGDKTLRVSYNWIPTGTVRRMAGVVNIKNRY